MTYRVEGAVTRRRTEKPVAGVTVRIKQRGVGRSLGEALTGQDGRYTLDVDIEAAPTDDLDVEVFDRSGAAVPHEMICAFVYDRVEALLELEVEPGSQPGREIFADEIISVTARTLPLEDLAMAYRYWQRRTDTLPPDLEAAFPELASRREQTHMEECGASVLPAMLRLAQIRPDHDWKAFAPAHDFSPYDPELVREFRGRRVKVRYVWGVGVGFGANPPNDVLQPGTKNRLGTITPARVQKIALIADDAIDKFAAMGLPSHQLWTLEPLEIRVLVGQFLGWTSPIPGVDYVQIDPRMLDDLEFSVVPHEIFHRLQYTLATDDPRDEPVLRCSIREGGARLAEDCVYDVPNKYVSSASVLFASPQYPFFRDDISAQYATGIFWKYLAERFGLSRDAPSFGMDSYLEILRSVGPLGHTIEALRQAVLAACGEPLDDIWFDFLLKIRLHNLTVPRVHAFEEEDESVDPVVRTSFPSLAGTHVTSADVDLAAPKRAVRIAVELPPWAARFQEIVHLPEPVAVLEVTRLGGTTAAVFVIQLGRDGRLVTLRRMTDVSTSVRMSVRPGERVLLIHGTAGEHGSTRVRCRLVSERS